MEKSDLEKFVNELKQAKIENYYIRYENGNRFDASHSESSRLYIRDAYVINISTESNNYASDTGRFNIKCIPYDNIENAGTPDLTTQQLLDFISVEGLELDDDLKQFIAKNGSRVILKPGYGGYGEITDKDGNPVIDGNIPVRVTTGFNK